MRRTGVFLSGLLLSSATLMLDDEPESSNRYRIYFGNLHSHTSYSDGSSTPEDAYSYARQAGLDFLAITEHNHRKAEQGAGERADGILIAKDSQLYRDLIRAAHKKNRKDFVTFWGQEFSTIESGNHANVFGALHLIDESDVPNGNFRALYENWLPQRPEVEVLQFNHPWDGKNKSLSYGRDDYQGSYGKLRNASQNWLRLIEVINGPGTKPQQGLRATVKGETYFRQYLTRGFRLAPTADQDNHYRTWGTLTDARTGVLASELTRSALLTAWGARRCYASTDKNLRVWFEVDGIVMGGETETDTRRLVIRYKIEDKDEPQAEYRLLLVSGNPSISDSDAEEVIADERGDHAAEVEFTTAHDSSFVYLKLVQWPKQAAKKDFVLTSPVWVEVR